MVNLRYHAALVGFVLLVACGTLHGVEATPEGDAGSDATAPPSTMSEGGDARGAQDAGDAAPDGPRYVFVTSATFAPGVDFTDVAGADALCNQAALAGHMDVQGRTFVAWISTAATSPAARFVKSTGAYRRVNRTDSIATGWTDLTTTAQLDKNLDITEHGANVADAGSAFTWTATTATGDYAGTGDCAGWSMASGGLSAAVGDPSQKSVPQWTQDMPQDCGQRGHLYCFEK